VQIDSEITLDFQPPPTSGSYHYHHVSEVTLAPVASQGSPQWQGSAPGTFSDASGSATTTTSCGSASETRSTATTITGSNGGTTTVSKFRFPLTSKDPDQSFVLSMSSDASETYHSESTGCGFPDSSDDSTDTTWFDSLADDHQAIGEGSGGVVDFHLNPGAGDVIASRTYSLDGETTTVRVSHIPPPP
jgi:hypothetical protein